MHILRRLVPFLRLLSLCVVLLTLIQIGVAVGQTLTTDKPPDVKIWELALKFFFGVIIPTVSPWVTSAISHAVGGLPIQAKYFISGLMGLIQGGLAGAIPDFPLTIESGMEMGIASGAGGQVAWSHIPSESKAAVAAKP